MQNRLRRKRNEVFLNKAIKISFPDTVLSYYNENNIVNFPGLSGQKNTKKTRKYKYIENNLGGGE